MWLPVSSATHARMTLKDQLRAEWVLHRGALRAVIEALYPDEVNPYRLVEHLINEGLRLLDKGDGLPPDVAGLLLADTSR